MRHVFAVTPIHVDELELVRRRRRYAALAPEGLDVHLVDIGPDAPSRLETSTDLRASEKAVAAVLGGDEAARYDVRLPDCVLDPGVPPGRRRHAPHGMLRLCLEHLTESGHRIAAVTRNVAIGDELQRRVEEYGFGDDFRCVRVLDLDVDSIADPGRWNVAMAEALDTLAASGATAVINGCSAVDIAPTSGKGPLVIDPTATALRLLGSGGAGE